MDNLLDGSVIVALSILGLIASISIAAIVRYPKVNDALKIIGVLSSLMGVVTGAFVTYFFTKPQIISAQESLASIQAENTQLQSRIADLTGSLEIFENIVLKSPDGENETMLVPAKYEKVTERIMEDAIVKICDRQKDGSCVFREEKELRLVPVKK